MFKASLVILKTYENALLKLKYEELLNFLINEILKSKFFHNDNYITYLYNLKSIKLNNDLIDNLQIEYMKGDNLQINL